MKIDEQVVSISEDQFYDMRTQADKVLQKLIKNMIEKESNEGELTIKVSVKFIPEYVDNGPGKTPRKALKPSYEHKISSQMKIQDQEAGKSYDEMKEVVFDEETGQYVTRYIHGAEQMNLFEYEEQKRKEQSSVDSQPIENERQLLPGPSNLLSDRSGGQENGENTRDEYAVDTENPSDDEKGYIDADYVEIDNDIEVEEENVIESDSEAELPESEEDSEAEQPGMMQRYDSESDDTMFLEDYENFENYSYDEPIYDDPSYDDPDAEERSV